MRLAEGRNTESLSVTSMPMPLLNVSVVADLERDKGVLEVPRIGVCASVVEFNRRGRTNGYLFADCLADCSGLLGEDAI